MSKGNWKIQWNAALKYLSYRYYVMYSAKQFEYEDEGDSFSTNPKKKNATAKSSVNFLLCRVRKLRDQ